MNSHHFIETHLKSYFCLHCLKQLWSKYSSHAVPCCNSHEVALSQLLLVGFLFQDFHIHKLSCNMQNCLPSAFKEVREDTFCFLAPTSTPNQKQTFLFLSYALRDNWNNCKMHAEVEEDLSTSSETTFYMNQYLYIALQNYRFCYQYSCKSGI